MRYTKPVIVSVVDAVSAVRGSMKNFSNAETDHNYTPSPAYSADE